MVMAVRSVCRRHGHPANRVDCSSCRWVFVVRALGGGMHDPSSTIKGAAIATRGPIPSSEYGLSSCWKVKGWDGARTSVNALIST